MPNTHKMYGPKKFRPTSLSIVTVTPEIQSRLQKLGNLQTIPHFPEGYDWRDFAECDEDEEEEYENQNQNHNKPDHHHHHRVIVFADDVDVSQYSESSNKTTLQENDDHHEDEEDDDDNHNHNHGDNHHQVEQFTNNSNTTSTESSANNNNENNNNNINNRFSKTPDRAAAAVLESSLLRYVLPHEKANLRKTPLPSPIGIGPETGSSIVSFNGSESKRRLQSILKQTSVTNDNNNFRETMSIASSPSRIETVSQIVDFSGDENDEKDSTSSIGSCSIKNHNNNHHHDDDNDGYGDDHEDDESSKQVMSERMYRLASIIYALVLVVIGVIVTVSDMANPVNNNDHTFSIIATAIGIAFLAAIHFDVQRHKRFVMRWERKRKEAIEAPMMRRSNNNNNSGGLSQKDFDTISVTTAIIFNRQYYSTNGDDQQLSTIIDDQLRRRLHSYKFATGKHSGNFYLKIGMTLFCMGSIVHQGINVALQIHFYTHNIEHCQNWISLIVYLVRCISAFYQLYMAFKYSNLIINRRPVMVMFGMMHLLGVSISFWFSTIIEEAMDGYTSKIRDSYRNGTSIPSIPEEIMFHRAIDRQINCTAEGLTNSATIDAMPFLYPFTIEYNIVLASVWYIIWTNIGSEDPLSQLSHVREQIAQDEHTGDMDVHYRSNVTISADCHASNLGLFGGLLSLLAVLVSTVLFFATINEADYREIGVRLYTGQFGFLTACSLVAVPLAWRATRRLSIVARSHISNSAATMDDLLLLLPLPFFYVHHILSIYSEIRAGTENALMMATIYVLHLVQVTLQTPFLVDGIRRCSNERKHRLRKPGKGLITFAIIINVALWIMITFEIKMADKYHSMQKRYGKFTWMIILDTCLPLMLFYRFHSSVCLSDMWQHAYQKDY